MLTHDYDLKNSEIQQLSSANALTGMFTALGYETGTRLTQTPEALGFPESLTREVLRIERIADQEAGALQVYLLEMKHVTVALTQALARVFKNRAGLFLLVLTTLDYDRLDFVLMEPVAPEAQSTGGIGAPQTMLRPRILSVERRNPDRVSLRVLRRFSYTEIDSDYQWDKLRSAYGVAEWSEPLFNNRALFSDYYLNERLPQRAEWQEDPRPAYRAISALMAEVRQKYAGQPESQMRLGLLEPVLKALGWTVENGKGAKDDSLEPDYWLSALTPGPSPENRSGERIPCLAYAWDRTLDGMDDKRDADTPSENPAQTVVSILENLDENAVGWAIVTNGKTWRLYSARAHSRATNYYEIDLEETLASPDVGEAFRYFWLFFRAKAFGGEGLPSFVDSLLTESASYAKALGERLKENVFENVFPKFAAGFIKQWGKPAVELTAAELDETFHATLTFLYRLLFLLYAEARDLLPVKETRGYYAISLKRMKEELAARAGQIADLAPEKLKAAYSVSETGLYDRLGELFGAVDKGQPEINVPMYNGGLFITDVWQIDDSSDENRAARFLATRKIPDRFLAQGLDLLARDIDEKTQALALIDYKSLGVRQLGSIYEGLLEFKLRVASEKMAVVAGKKDDEIVPYKAAATQKLKVKSTGKGAARAEFVIQTGEVYLENDKHERKASGSYYTPDYIVKYIVQNTVGPALEAKTESLRPKLREAQKAHAAALERQKAFQKMGQKGDDPEKTAYTFRGLVDELFDLRVLDPAMGSGHFLVEAVDFITDRLLAYLNAFPWNPVTAALRQTRATILEEMARQGVNVDPARLTDVNLLKRHVLKRCIYGVDLNPMAVELAKVSLWLDCFTLGAPLSFLDHHLKPGNSLIGARIEEVRAALEMAVERERLEIPLLMGVMGGSQFAGVMMSVDLMRHVGELSDVTAAQVRESRVEYAKAADALAPYKRILDVYTSRWFGNADTKLDQPAISFLRDERHLPWIQHRADLTTIKPASRLIAETALKAARERRFFHWELEFPEVFFGASKASQQQIVMKDNPGFDAVIGNPPYDVLAEKERDEDLSEVTSFLDNSSTYRPALGRKLDLYRVFLALGGFVGKPNGAVGFIVPMSLLCDQQTENIRNYILKEFTFLRLNAFPQKDDPDRRIFYEAKLATCVPIVQRTHPKTSDTFVLKIHPGKLLEEVSGINTINYARLNLLIPFTGGIPLTHSDDEFNLLYKLYGSEKFETVGKHLVTYQGEINETVHIKFLSEDPAKGTLVYRGSNIQRYDFVEESKQGRVLHLNEKAFLEKYAQGQNKATHTRLLRYGYQRKAALDNWRRLIFGPLPKPSYCFESVSYFLDEGLKSRFFMALLNSRLLEWRFGLTSTNNMVSTDEIASLPLRRIAFTTPAARREGLVREALALVAAENASALLALTAACLSAQPEESDVIHDLLASLAERMINLNKSKQAEMKRFLTWLESLLKANLDDLTGKSKLKNYLGDYQKSEPEVSYAELEDILYKNKGKLGISLSDSRLTAKLREEYEKSLAVLRPLKASLAWTDGVIDQVVYQLYGLTEEEIRIVEGKA